MKVKQVVKEKDVQVEINRRHLIELEYVRACLADPERRKMLLGKGLTIPPSRRS